MGFTIYRFTMNTFPIYVANNRQLYSIVNQSYIVHRQIVTFSKVLTFVLSYGQLTLI